MKHLRQLLPAFTLLLLMGMQTPSAVAQMPENITSAVRRMIEAALSGSDTTAVQPQYRRASYTGESVELKNDDMKLVMYRRIGGWGFGEVYNASGKLMAVLDHLGELMIRDQDIPMRFEAQDVRKVSGEAGESLIFDVKSVVVRDNLAGTSFERWMRYPFFEPAIVGEVTLTLAKDKPLLYMKYRLEATGNYYARYIRGPWIKVGEASFGTAKDDAIFPGIEWNLDDEWSSGLDWFKDPWAMRAVPHPNQVAIPMMALSHDGTGIGLSWNPTQVATRWFNYRTHHPQPVFAAPNFLDRMNNSLMGLMIPDATIEGHENEIYATIPLELKIGQQINFDAELWLTEGISLDVVTDWVKRHGFPEPPEPKWPYKETLDRIANAYNTNLWHEGEGFGIKQGDAARWISKNVPGFMDRYLQDNRNTPLARELRRKVEWCRAETGAQGRGAQRSPEQLNARAEEILARQREDGSYPFEPFGHHYRKDDFIVATSFVEPMGLDGATALEMNMAPTLELIGIVRETGNEAHKAAIVKALEFCMPMTRPEGGDFWETPLHAPNLLAAGNAAVTYYEAYRLLGDERYKQKAIHWIRSIIPFTHLWEPTQIGMMYNTKPCLCSSDWYFANWVRDHVQWEVLAVFRNSYQRGIRWSEIDPELDWDRFHEGITVAAIRWMSIHAEDNWRPHNIPASYKQYVQGEFDYCYPDTFNSITGNYGGMMIPPDPIAINIQAVLDYKK